MPYVVVRARAQDYAQWQRVFQEGVSMRREMGIKSEQVYRNPDDPNEGVVLFEVDDTQRGLQAMQAPQAQEARRRAGLSDVKFYVPAE